MCLFIHYIILNIYTYIYAYIYKKLKEITLKKNEIKNLLSYSDYLQLKENVVKESIINFEIENIEITAALIKLKLDSFINCSNKLNDVVQVQNQPKKCLQLTMLKMQQISSHTSILDLKIIAISKLIKLSHDIKKTFNNIYTEENYF